MTRESIAGNTLKVKGTPKPDNPESGINKGWFRRLMAYIRYRIRISISLLVLTVLIGFVVKSLGFEKDSFVSSVGEIIAYLGAENYGGAVEKVKELKVEKVKDFSYVLGSAHPYLTSLEKQQEVTILSRFVYLGKGIAFSKRAMRVQHEDEDCTNNCDVLLDGYDAEEAQEFCSDLYGETSRTPTLEEYKKAYSFHILRDVKKEKDKLLMTSSVSPDVPFWRAIFTTSSSMKNRLKDYQNKGKNGREDYLIDELEAPDMAFHCVIKVDPGYKVENG